MSDAARVRYEGEFELAWLRDGERVMSAGDGTGAAIIVSPDGSERRVNIGDEIPAKSGPGQAPSFLSRRPASETETAGASSSAAYLRLVGWFVAGITAMGFYVWLALVNVNLFLIWPLLVIVVLSIFKCWTAADGPVGSRWP